MKQLLIATGNQGKFNEIKTILSNLKLEIISLNDVNVNNSEFIEDEETFAKNAEKKAKFYALQTKIMTLADDSGLIVDALKNELGVKTRRWGAGEKASDEEWLNYFLKRMENEENRKAKFVSCICLVNEEGKVLTTGQGEVKGELLRELQVPIKSGVPLSSIFVPKGCKKVHSAMTTEEKCKVSHRGKAARKIREYLAKEYTGL